MLVKRIIPSLDVENGRVVVAFDALRAMTNAPPTWNVVVHARRMNAGSDVIARADRVVELGAGTILSRDVGTREHIDEGLSAGGADGALCASIFHDDTFTVVDAKNDLAERGLTVRPAPRTHQPREMS